MTEVRETRINIDKFIGLKELVDRKALKKKEACEILGITNGTYNKLNRKMEAFRNKE